MKYVWNLEENLEIWKKKHGNQWFKAKFGEISDRGNLKDDGWGKLEEMSRNMKEKYKKSTRL